MSNDQLRSSQIVTTFGPGAMVDLPEASVIIGGLDHWNYDRSQIPIVEEPRLVGKLRALLEVDTLTLRTPPPAANQDHGFQPDIVVWRFPEWFIVQNTIVTPRGFRRRKLVHLNNLDHMKYLDDDRKKYSVVPVRFVRACRKGHVGDIDWKSFVHGASTGCPRNLWLEERGTTGDLDEIYVVCECGADRVMSQAARPDLRALGSCNGSRPWLGAGTRESCGEANRLLIRSASNAYFPQQLSVISIPDTRRPVDEAVRSLWEDFLVDVEAPEDLIKARRKPTVAAKLQGLSDEDVWAAISHVRAGDDDTTKRTVKEVEFEALSEAQEELGSDVPDGYFFARSLPSAHWEAPWMQAIERVVLVHRLREVIAQVGFTRFEAAGPDIQGELMDLSVGVERAPLASDLTWLPAVENRGEGIFLLFKAKAIGDWLKKQGVKDRGTQLARGYQRWKDEKGALREFTGLPYYFLHSLSHLLLTVISLDCGYPASSLRERVYAAPDRYGILIYTGSSDAEGTLGGLVQAGREIKRYMLLALERGRLCSNDPICAHHSPMQHDQQLLLGSACHGCLLIAETSCEQANNFLDRSLVVQTIEGLGAEFFDAVF
jgi:Domain of unknown function (DUF1998)